MIFLLWVRFAKLIICLLHVFSFIKFYAVESVANLLCCDILVNEFKLEIMFTFGLEKYMNSLNHHL